MTVPDFVDGNAPLTVGQFRYYIAADLAEWPAEVALHTATPPLR